MRGADKNMNWLENDPNIDTRTICGIRICIDRTACNLKNGSCAINACLQKGSCVKDF